MAIIRFATTTEPSTTPPTDKVYMWVDASGNINLKDDAGNVTSLGGGGGGGGLDWNNVVSSATTMSADNGYPVDVSSAAVTMTFPSSPSVGDEVGVLDYTHNANTNNITLDRNGENIEGSASNVTLSTDGIGQRWIYTGSTRGWEKSGEWNEAASASSATEPAVIPAPSFGFPDDDWTPNSFDPDEVDGFEVANLDSSTDEGFVAIAPEVPSGVTDLKIVIWSRGYAGSNSGTVYLDVLEKHAGDGESLTVETSIASAETFSIGANTYWQKKTVTIGLSGASLSAGDLLQLCIRRDADNASDDLSDDLSVQRVEVWYE